MLSKELRSTLRPGDSLSSLYLDVFDHEDEQYRLNPEQRHRLVRFLQGRVTQHAASCSFSASEYLDQFDNTHPPHPKNQHSASPRRCNDAVEARDKRRRSSSDVPKTPHNIIDTEGRREISTAKRKACGVTGAAADCDFYSYVRGKKVLDATRREEHNSKHLIATDGILLLEETKEKRLFFPMPSSNLTPPAWRSLLKDASRQQERQTAALAILKQRLCYAMEERDSRSDDLALPFFFQGLPARPFSETYPSALRAISPYLASVSADGLTAWYRKETTSQAGFGTVLTDFPIPSSGLAYYFEVRLLPPENDDGDRSARRGPLITIGIAFPRAECEEIVDSDFHYVGYRSEDGYRLGIDAPRPFAVPFGYNDVVGCCIRFHHSITFTKNGNAVASVPLSPDLVSPVIRHAILGDTTRLFPMISMAGPGDRVTVNLGCSSCLCLQNGSLGIQLVDPEREKQLDQLFSFEQKVFPDTLLSAAQKTSSCVCLFFGIVPVWLQKVRSQRFPPPQFLYNYEKLVVQKVLKAHHTTVLQMPLDNAPLPGTLSKKQTVTAKASHRRRLYLPRAPTPPGTREPVRTDLHRVAEEPAQPSELFSQEMNSTSLDNAVARTTGNEEASDEQRLTRSVTATTTEAQSVVAARLAHRPMLEMATRLTQRATTSQRSTARRPLGDSADSASLGDPRRTAVRHPITPPAPSVLSTPRTVDFFHGNRRPHPSFSGVFTATSSSSTGTRNRRNSDRHPENSSEEPTRTPSLRACSLLGQLTVGVVHRPSFNYGLTGLTDAEGIIMSFLLHSGYLRTLCAFCKETDLRQQITVPIVASSSKACTASDDSASSQTRQPLKNTTLRKSPQLTTLKGWWDLFGRVASENASESSSTKLGVKVERGGALQFVGPTHLFVGVQKLYCRLSLAGLHCILEDLERDKVFWEEHCEHFTVKKHKEQALDKVTTPTPDVTETLEDVPNTSAQLLSIPLDEAFEPKNDYVFCRLTQYMADSTRLCRDVSRDVLFRSGLRVSKQSIPRATSAPPSQRVPGSSTKRRVFLAEQKNWICDQEGQTFAWENDRALLYDQLHLSPKISSSEDPSHPLSDHVQYPATMENTSAFFLFGTRLQNDASRPSAQTDKSVTPPPNIKGSSTPSSCSSVSTSSSFDAEDAVAPSVRTASAFAVPRKRVCRSSRREASRHAKKAIPLPRLTLSGLALIEQAFRFCRTESNRACELSLEKSAEYSDQPTLIGALLTHGLVPIPKVLDDIEDNNSCRFPGLSSRVAQTLRWIAVFRQELRTLILAGHVLTAIEFFRLFLPTCFLDGPLPLALIFLLTQYLLEVVHAGSDVGLESDAHEETKNSPSLLAVARRIDRCRALWIRQQASFLFDSHLSENQRLSTCTSAIPVSNQSCSTERNPVPGDHEHYEVIQKQFDPISKNRDEQRVQQLQLNCDAKLLMSADSPLITAVKKDQVALWWTRYILRPLFSRLDQQSRSVLVEAMQVLHEPKPTSWLLKRRQCVAELLDNYLLDHHFGIETQSPLAILLKYATLLGLLHQQKEKQHKIPVTVRSITWYGKGYLQLEDSLLAPLVSFGTVENMPFLNDTRRLSRPFTSYFPLLIPIGTTDGAFSAP